MAQGDGASQQRSGAASTGSANARGGRDGPAGYCRLVCAKHQSPQATSTSDKSGWPVSRNKMANTMEKLILNQSKDEFGFC